MYHGQNRETRRRMKFIVGKDGEPHEITALGALLLAVMNLNRLTGRCKRYFKGGGEAALGLFAIILLPLLLWTCGCASAQIKDAKGKLIYEVSGSGIFRNVKGSYVKRPDGSEEVTISSESTTADILGGVNNVLGTATGTLKP